jgi:MFS family permease
MRNLWWDGFFAECTEIIWLQFLALYAVAMGAGIGLIGILAATTNLLAAISMWPGSLLAERTRKYKTIVMVCGGVLNRLPFLLLAALPWITTGNTALAVIFVVCAVKGFFGNIAMPAWSAYCADFIPEGLRGRYFASRNFIRQVADLAIAPLAGLVIFMFGGFSGWSITWLMAFAFGMASTWFFGLIPNESNFGKHDYNVASRPEKSASALNDRRLLWFVGASAVFQLSVMIAGPFFAVYFVDQLGASTLWVGITAAAMPAAGIVAQPLIGRLNDRLGPKWLLVVSGLLFPIAPWFWLLATEPWQIFIPNAIAGVLWSANLLASFNLLLEIAPADKRPSYSGLHQAGMFFAAFLGPLAGGFLIAALGFHAVFVISGAGRFLATLVLWRTVSVDESASLPKPVHIEATAAT